MILLESRSILKVRGNHNNGMGFTGSKTFQNNLAYTKWLNTVE